MNEQRRIDSMVPAFKPNRRSFLKGSALGAAMLGLGGTSLAACTTSDKTATGKKTGAWAKGPVKFVFLDTQEPSHLDPAFQLEFDEFVISRNIYEPLVDLNETTEELIPCLATKWIDSPDGLTHTFTLRQGVSFHDGSSLDADVVVTNIKRYLSIAQGEASLLSNVKDATAVDKGTVRIITKGPDPWVAAHLTKFGMISGKAIADHKSGQDPWAKDFFASNAIGTGPYTFVEWRKGTDIKLAKNRNWWSKASWLPGSIDEVTILPTADSSSRVRLIERGDADFCTQWTVRDALDVGKLPGFELDEVKTFDISPIIQMNFQKAPFDRLEVRQAFQCAFDYKAMSDFYLGRSEATTGLVPADFPGGAADLPAFKQDLSKAKALLTSAGIAPASLKVDFWTPTGYNGLNAGATIMQSSLRKIDVNMTVQKIPFGQIVSAYSKPSTAGQIMDENLSPFTIDPGQLLAYLTPGSFGGSFTNFDNKDIQNQIQKMETTLDAKERARILLDVQHKIHDVAPFVLGGRPHTMVARPSYVTGYVMQKLDYRFPVRFAQLRVKEH